MHNYRKVYLRRALEATGKPPRVNAHLSESVSPKGAWGAIGKPPKKQPPQGGKPKGHTANLFGFMRIYGTSERTPEITEKARGQTSGCYLYYQAAAENTLPFPTFIAISSQGCACKNIICEGAHCVKSSLRRPLTALQTHVKDRNRKRQAPIIKGLPRNYLFSCAAFST